MIDTMTPLITPLIPTLGNNTAFVLFGHQIKWLLFFSSINNIAFVIMLL